MVNEFKEDHNHDLVIPDCAHRLSSQRKISELQGIDVELAELSGIRLLQHMSLWIGKLEEGIECL